jgi:hypothetical protein
VVLQRFGVNGEIAEGGTGGIEGFVGAIGYVCEREEGSYAEVHHGGTKGSREKKSCQKIFSEIPRPWLRGLEDDDIADFILTISVSPTTNYVS